MVLLVCGGGRGGIVLCSWSMCKLEHRQTVFCYPCKCSQCPLALVDAACHAPHQSLLTPDISIIPSLLTAIPAWIVGILTPWTNYFDSYFFFPRNSENGRVLLAKTSNRIRARLCRAERPTHVALHHPSAVADVP